MTIENDVVLIYYDNKPFSFARVEDISADIKKDWYNVRLLMLQIPLQIVTWILREEYINGVEFTIGGQKMRLEKVVAPPDPFFKKKEHEDEIKPNKPSKIVSLAERRKKKTVNKQDDLPPVSA